MNSWWQLGESYGHMGSELSLYLIECAFCGEKGNWELVANHKKQKPNSSKVLNFDIYKCGNCAGFIHVLWSASEHIGRHGLHSFRVLPWPVSNKVTAPEHWPDGVKRYWEQAHNTYRTDNYDASAVMARGALQVALRMQGAEGSNLKNEIDDLTTKGILPNIMCKWSDEIRFLGNNSAHPNAEQEKIDPKDLKDVIKFMDFLFEYLFDLPKQINDYRARRKKEEKADN